jgi:hypothetical protein
MGQETKHPLQFVPHSKARECAVACLKVEIEQEDKK